MNMEISTIEKQAAACNFHLPVILLADDDADDRNFFSEVLEMTKEKVELVMVKDGEEVMQYLQSFPLPQLIFLDLNMPRKNGTQCLAAIKSNQLWSASPVVILSTSINEAKRNQLIEEGASDCFIKPSDCNTLLNLLQKSILLIRHTSQIQLSPGSR
jgi:CheY-like chemotaxis protein